MLFSGRKVQNINTTCVNMTSLVLSQEILSWFDRVLRCPYHTYDHFYTYRTKNFLGNRQNSQKRWIQHFWIVVAFRKCCILILHADISSRAIPLSWQFVLSYRNRSFRPYFMSKNSIYLFYSDKHNTWCKNLFRDN